MEPSKETETSTILSSVCSILKVPYGKAVIIKLATCDEKVVAEWCETSFNKLSENNVPNVTHTTNEVVSPNGTEININQKEISSNAPINSENSSLNVACEESCSPNNENRKRLRSRSVSPTPEEIYKKNSSDVGATMKELVENINFEEKKRLMEREKEIDEEIRNKNISGMREKSLLDEKSKIRKKMIMIKREVDVIPVFDLIDLETTNSSSEPKPFIKESIQASKERQGPSPPKIRSPIKLRSTPSQSLHQSSLSDTEVDVDSFSDTDITPNDVSIPSISDILSTKKRPNRIIASRNQRKIVNSRPEKPILVETDSAFEEEKYIHPNSRVMPEDTPGRVTNQPVAVKRAVLTRQNEICGYKLSPKEWQCSTCSRVLASIHNLRIHSAFLHGRGDSFKCGRCRRKFIVEERYRDHMASVCSPQARHTKSAPTRQRSQSVYHTTF